MKRETDQAISKPDFEYAYTVCRKTTTGTCRILSIKMPQLVFDHLWLIKLSIMCWIVHPFQGLSRRKRRCSIKTLLME